MTTLTATPSVFECPTGLRKLNGASALWVRSPRTGNTLVITAEHFAKLPDRLVSRVAQAAATGRHVLPFSREELHAVAQAVKPTPTPEPAKPSPVSPACARRTFWGSPAMAKAQACPAAVPQASVDPTPAVASPVQRLPAVIGREGIHNQPYLCITLPDRTIVLRPFDWPRLPVGLIDRVWAATVAGETSMDFTADELKTIESVRAAVDKAIAANTGVARSTHARGTGW